MVGIVVVSHSASLAEGVRELAEQMVQGRVLLATAAVQAMVGGSLAQVWAAPSVPGVKAALQQWSLPQAEALAAEVLGLDSVTAVQSHLEAAQK